MKKVVALAMSDLHINLWNKFNANNRRTLVHLEVLLSICKTAKKLGVPVLFAGDLFHKPENMDQELFELVIKSFKSLSSDLVCIQGNHDIKSTSRVGEKPTGWISLFSEYHNRIECIDYSSYHLGVSNIIVHGVPYVDHNIGLCDYLSKMRLDKDCKHILMLHTDYPGAKDTDGREVGSVENLNINTLSRFDLVLCGHIHKPQRLSKKVYMLGAPLQQRRTDKDNELGYWEVYDDLSVKFIPLEDNPKFIDVEKEEDIKEDGNYYTLLPKRVEQQTFVENNKITKTLSKSKLARVYCRETGIKDKDKKKLLIKILKEAEND